MEKGLFVQKNMDGKFCFDLLAGDGLVLCRSVGYETEEECQGAIEMLRTACASPVADKTAEAAGNWNCPTYEIYQNENGEFKFLLKDEQGSVVINSPDFSARHTCRKGIEKIKRFAPDAKLIISTYVGKPGEIVAGQALNI